LTEYLDPAAYLTAKVITMELTSYFARNHKNPEAKINAGILDYLKRYGVSHASDLVGTLALHAASSKICTG
jgi:hypothetical protein